MTEKNLDESLIWDQLNKYSKKGTPALKKSTKKLIEGLHENAAVYHDKVEEVQRVFQESQVEAKAASAAASAAMASSIAARRGPLVAPSPTDRDENEYIERKKNLTKTRVRLDQICGWKITYTYGNHILWLVTPSAMYMLLSEQITTHGEIVMQPSPIYSSTFVSMQKKMTACSSIVHLLQTWIAGDVRPNTISMKMLARAMVSGDQSGGGGSSSGGSSAGHDGDDEDGDVDMVEAAEAAEAAEEEKMAQKVVLKKMTDYLLRHPLFITEQIKRHDQQDYRRWLRYGGDRKMSDQKKSLLQKAAQVIAASATSSSSSPSSSSPSSSSPSSSSSSPSSSSLPSSASTGAALALPALLAAPLRLPVTAGKVPRLKPLRWTVRAPTTENATRPEKGWPSRT